MNLRQYLDAYDGETLKMLARFCGVKLAAGSKRAWADQIEAQLLSPQGLRRQWEQLDDIERKAVAYALYNDGEFHASAFRAQYGRLPARPQTGLYWYHVGNIRLDVFLHGDRLPDDIIPILKEWVPKPEPFRITGHAKAPDRVHVQPLLRADTENTGQADLATVLSLVEQGQLTFNNHTGLPTPGALRKLLQALAEGDFWPMPEKATLTDVIRPAGLCSFALHGGFLEYSRFGHLKLSEAGLEWLHSQKPQLLLDAFERWTHAAGGDELQRLRGVRNRNSRTLRLSSPGERRERIVEALSWCPVGEWINVEDFFRGIQAWQLDFEVETLPEKRLYVGPTSVGPWARDFDYWRAINGLYILAVLWESLASIGALDIVYLKPEDAQYDVALEEDLAEEYLSLYDGLRCFRINDLGAYLFGQHSSYVSAAQRRPPFLEALAGSVIRVTAPEHATAADHLLLASFATPVGDGVYRLDLDSLLGALDAKRDLGTARGYLSQWLAGGLPGEMNALFSLAVERSEAFGTPEPAVTIKAETRELAALVTKDSKLKAYCRLASERTIVLPRNRLTAFRKRLRELGYVLPE